jgi:hypothetical protein
MTTQRGSMLSVTPKWPGSSTTLLVNLNRQSLYLLDNYNSKVRSYGLKPSLVTYLGDKVGYYLVETEDFGGNLQNTHNDFEMSLQYGALARAFWKYKHE